ncbi:hypothetical protein SEUCBS139899_005476 [Sporothrix eucalyptigena]|uniref:Integral membrane protein n=1 Tax=Sporothrix eucalyptigena TaxID=1812306 RepID=A0ABP0BKX4_9PEZI
MAPSRRLGSIETVVAFLWEITFTFFVMRLSFVYAALALTSTALLACLAHAAVLPFLAARQQVPAQTLLDNVLLGATNSTTKTALLVLVSALVVVVVGICSRVVMNYAKIPQLRRFRGAIGGMAATFLGLGWIAARIFLPSFCAGQTFVDGHSNHVVVDKIPTPTNPHMFTPTGDGTMSMTSFCQKSRVSIGRVHNSLNSVSLCTIVGIVFIAAVALMPWLSMILLERPNRRYGHQRISSNNGWSTPTKTPASRSTSTARSSYEKKTPLVQVTSYSSSEEEVASRRTRAPKTRSKTGTKRYSLRTSTERRSPQRLE